MGIRKCCWSGVFREWCGVPGEVYSESLILGGWEGFILGEGSSSRNARWRKISRSTVVSVLNISTQCYSPPEVDRIWGIWGSYYNIPKAIFYLPKGDYRVKGDNVSSMLSLGVSEGLQGVFNRAHMGHGLNSLKGVK